jgi:hypothetical protein
MEILRMLSLRGRLASLEQIAHTWWHGVAQPVGTCQDRLRRLENAGLLLRQRLLAIALAELVGPLIHWAPGRYVPDLGVLAWQLHQRWKTPVRPTTIFQATSRCARYFGGRRKGHIARPFQVSHDLGVTQMFLAVRLANPRFVTHWIDEDRLAPARRGQKLPDAVIATDITALPSLVLEFGGDYGKSRLQAFHDDCESRGLPYQIW